MSKLRISNLFTYPLKSTKGIALQSSEVGPLGLKDDRTFAVIANDNHFVTGRENQKLLKISCAVEDSKLILSTTDKGSMELVLDDTLKFEEQEVFLFKKAAKGKVIQHRINNWLTLVLEQNVRLITINNSELRTISDRHQPKENDRIAFCDGIPVHLFSEASLAHLNAQIENPVSLHNFRPNIVVTGCEAYEEETWKRIRIGECEFDVTGKTGRCIFITIDPKTLEKDKAGEPLNTLTNTRKENNRVNFGMGLIPRKLGTIHVNDEIEILE